jgi:hypothetical protein
MIATSLTPILLAIEARSHTPIQIWQYSLGKVTLLAPTVPELVVTDPDHRGIRIESKELYKKSLNPAVEIVVLLYKHRCRNGLWAYSMLDLQGFFVNQRRRM